MAVAGILSGFGCRLLAYDPAPDPGLTALGGRYVELPELLSGADVITLPCPLTPATRHMIGADAVAMMKPGVMLINTSRGAVVGTAAGIPGLKSGKTGYLGLHVYGEAERLCFKYLSATMNQDEVFARR